MQAITVLEHAYGVVLRVLLSRAYILLGWANHRRPQQPRRTPNSGLFFIPFFFLVERREGGDKKEKRGKIYMLNGCGYGFYGRLELSRLMTTGVFYTHEMKFFFYKGKGVDYGHDLTGSWGRKPTVGGVLGGGCI